MGIAARAAARIAALLGVSAYTLPLPSTSIGITDAQIESVREAMGGQLQPMPQSQTRWYLDELEDAEHAADNGNLAFAARLMRSARKDGVVAGALSTRTGGLVRLPKRFRGRPEIVKALELGHEMTRSVFDEMCPATELALMAADGILCGVAVGELVPVEGRDYPVLVRLDPEFLFYRWSENRWYFRSIAGLLPITPGDGRWVLHTPGGRSSPWQNGLWRAVGRAFIRKEHASELRDNWNGTLANPARVAYAPLAATTEQHQSWFEQVLSWGTNNVFGLKPGYEVKLLESNGIGYKSFKETIGDCNEEMILALNGQTVTTDGGAGFQNSDIHKSVRADLIAETADGLSYTINTQVLPPYIFDRWGEEAIDDGAVVSWDVTPPKDRNSEATALVSAANAIKSAREALVGTGLEPDVEQICARFGLPVRKVVVSKDDAAANDDTSNVVPFKRDDAAEARAA